MCTAAWGCSGLAPPIARRRALKAVFNFIISRSAAQTVNVGTVGGTPLNVNFTDFNYWGVEGGQRVFFARTRFTPYVGFLFGINRNGDIRGTFAGRFPAADARPRGTRREVLREVMGAQFGPYRGIPRRPWPHRVDGRDAAALDERSVGCRLARRGGLARHQQRELAVVDPVHWSARGFGSDISDDEASDHEAWPRRSTPRRANLK